MKLPPIYTSPKLQDAVVQSLNTALSSYAELLYGIVHLGYDEDGNTYPSVYYNDGSFKNLMLFPDNKVKSFIFWEFEGSEVLDDDDGINYNLSLVFWGNLQRIDATKYYDHTSEIEQSIIQVLMTKEVTGITCNEDDVFANYSKYLEEEKQTLMRPNTGFKISFTIHDFVC